MFFAFLIMIGCFCSVSFTASAATLYWPVPGHTSLSQGFHGGNAIDTNDGRVYQYTHMQAGSIPGNVYYGATVSVGQVIGKVGTTGNSSGPHLHFGISLIPKVIWQQAGNLLITNGATLTQTVY